MKTQVKQVIGICLIVICVAAILFSGFKILNILNPSSEPIMQDTNEIQRDGVTYFPRQDINVMLVMGIGLFNMGADLAMTPMGTHVGSGLSKQRKLWLLLSVSFVLSCFKSSVLFFCRERRIVSAGSV